MKHKFTALLFTIIAILVFTTPVLAQNPSDRFDPFNDGGQVIFGRNFTLEAGEEINGDLAVFGGNVTTEPDSTVNGDLAAIGGNLIIDGTVNGDVGALGGQITIAGTVNGDVGAMGGAISVTDSANVDGDIGAIGGEVNVADGATVTGRVKVVGDEGTRDYSRGNDDNQNKDDRAGSTPPIPDGPRPPDDPFDHFGKDDFGSSYSSGVFGWFVRLVGDVVSTIALVIVLGLISWLVAAFMPEQMLNVRNALSESAALSFGVGLITMLVSIFVGVLLVITICLMFIPIIGWILLAVASLLGWIVIGQMFGERLLAASGRGDAGFIQSTIVGVVILTLLTSMPVIGQVPCIGWALGFVGGIIGAILSTAGLGAVLLTRFGTRPYPPAPSRSYGGFSGGPAPTGGFGGGSGRPRQRWTDPAPDVSDEDMPASDEELKARIKEALAEADDLDIDPPDLTPEPDVPTDEPPQPKA
jgi:cytoskeletal protein CcmA (bactofilin family)